MQEVMQEMKRSIGWGSKHITQPADLGDDPRSLRLLKEVQTDPWTLGILGKLFAAYAIASYYGGSPRIDVVAAHLASLQQGWFKMWAI